MRNLGIGTWIHRRRVKSADAVAIVDEEARITYAALAERIDRLANALAARGITHGDRVAYLGTNTAEFLETLFACGQIGAVFVPLNIRLAADEVAYALDDSGAALLVHGAAFTSLVAPTGVRRMVVATDPVEGAERYADVLTSAPAGHATCAGITPTSVCACPLIRSGSPTTSVRSP